MGLVNTKKRNVLIILLCIFGIIALAGIDISEYGKLTTGFKGVVVLISGLTLIPAIVELIKEKRR